MAKTYRCRLCSAQGFANPQLLGSHMRKEHPGQGIKSAYPQHQKEAPQGVTGAPETLNGKPTSRVINTTTLAEAISVLEVKRDAYAEVITILRELGGLQ